MIRAAAKNHGSVGVLVDVDDYATVIEEIAAGRGFPPEQVRKELNWQNESNH